jgi:AcrR family transcriptional regulator
VRRGLTSDVVVRAGADLADELGFDAVTISEVARRLGVRTPSLYSHVSSSADLATRICALALDELADLASEAISGCAGRSALLALLKTYGDYARRHPGRYAATRTGLPSMPSPADKGVATALAAGRRHAALLRAVLRDYDFSPDTEVHAIRLVGSVVRGFSSLDVAGGFEHSGPPSEETRDYIVDALDAMLRARRHA